MSVLRIFCERQHNQLFSKRIYYTLLGRVGREVSLHTVRRCMNYWGYEFFKLVLILLGIGSMGCKISVRLPKAQIGLDAAHESAPKK